MPSPAITGALTIWGGKKLTVDRLMPWYLDWGTDAALVAFQQTKSGGAASRFATKHTGRAVHWAARQAMAAGRPVLTRSALAVRGGLVRASSVAAPYAAAAALGYVGGAVVGTRLARAIDGDRGAAAALDLYTGQVSWDKYWATVREGLGTL